LSERDTVLAAEIDDGFGVPIGEELAHGIGVIGFADDAGDGDIVTIGFDEDQAPTAPGAAIDRGDQAAPRPRQKLAESLRGATAAAQEVVLAALWRLRFWLIGTHLRARRTRTAVVVIGALLLSVGCGLVLRGWLPARQAERTLEASPIALPAPAKSVLVASVAIPRGHLLRPTDLRWQPWPAGSIRKSYIELGSRNIPDLAGYAVRQSFAAGEPIGDGSIAAPGDRGFLAAALMPGMRAVSVDIKEETAASGLIMPGDEIDVLLALPVPTLDQPRDSGSLENRHAVETVLRNIPVLAIDQRLDAAPGKAMLGSTATVEVTPKQAEIIALSGYIAAYYSGNMSLSLKSLIANDAETQQPAAGISAANPHGGAASSSMTDSDISKLLPNRKTAAQHFGSLTILRRSAAEEANGS
jgi:pilus assembly protein CpaB